ncbi:hypothetical protein [Streptomyces bicolor]|uniref:hypothetical protein n=1 Tax=Streptomyces bicolor TaxID=66874 RepID=UPI000A6C1DC3|nr:hypothetical protein [Streptomyces bicolor]
MAVTEQRLSTMVLVIGTGGAGPPPRENLPNDLTARREKSFLDSRSSTVTRRDPVLSVLVQTEFFSERNPL